MLVVREYRYSMICRHLILECQSDRRILLAYYYSQADIGWRILDRGSS